MNHIDSSSQAGLASFVPLAVKVPRKDCPIIVPTALAKDAVTHVPKAA